VPVVLEVLKVLAEQKAPVVPEVGTVIVMLEKAVEVAMAVKVAMVELEVALLPENLLLLKLHQALHQP
jgi:hypothetical protein